MVMFWVILLGHKQIGSVCLVIGQGAAGSELVERDDSCSVT